MYQSDPNKIPNQPLPTMYDLPSEDFEDPPGLPDEYRIHNPPLPTMYDLPSEHPEDPGLPDQYHIYQPRLLQDTFRSENYPPDRVFLATDLNLYYDVHHPLWYKRPDWFAVVGVDRLVNKQDMRLSYVVWQEGVNPFVVVELLSPGTEKEDLGQTLRSAERPPTKWEVYERILRVPYYIVFDRSSDKLRAFRLTGSRYQELELSEPRIWIEDIELGLGLWEGKYEDISRKWLRWYDRQGNWIPNPEQRAEQEKQRAEQEKQRAEQEKQRAEQEKQRAEQEKQRAEQEKQRAEQEKQRAEQEKQRAEQEKQRAEQEKQRADKLAAKLRALGLDPDLDN